MSVCSTNVEIITKESVVNGKATKFECVEINGRSYAVSGHMLRIASIEDEWYEDVDDPASVIAALASSKARPDIFTFCQRVPYTEPKYDYPMEWESLAVLPIETYDHWWNKQLNSKTRNMIRKSQRLGVEVREASFDDEFVRGVVDIFNETRVRQGFRFWHYGKDFETVKKEFSRFLFREDLIGAYYQGELIGFAMLANAGRYAILTQFIAKIKHRDKATNNALMAKTIEVCEKRKLRYLVYTTWRQTSLVDFKRHSGFQEMMLPRYFVPLTHKGKLALKLGLQRSQYGWKELVPGVLRKLLKKLRRRWYALCWDMNKSGKPPA